MPVPRNSVAVISAADEPLSHHVVELLAHYGVSAHARDALSRRETALVVELRNLRQAALHIEGNEVPLLRWSIEDIVHGIDVVTGRVAAGCVHLALGGLQVVGADSRVRVDGRPVPLTATERRLVRHLLRKPRAVHSREHLLAHIWPAGYQGRAEIVETYVSYVRRKLPTSWRTIIRTSYGAGYSVDAP